jgi:steroid delta-isomerase-like uncharacterized protein
MGAAESKTIGRRFMEEVIGQGDWDLGAEIVSQDVVMIHPSSPQPVAGLEAVKGMLLGFRAGLPDMTMTVEDAIGEDDRAVILWRLRATHTADLFGLPPTGKRVEMPGVSIFRVTDGKVVHDIVSEDTMGLMRQLGVIPEG